MRQFLCPLTFLLISFISISNISLANNPGYSDKKGEITGVIKDSLSGKPLPYATLRLITASDPAKLTGYSADTNGFFHIKNISPGRYHLLVSYVGYSDKMLTFDINEQEISLEILLKESAYTLSEVKVTAEKSLIEEGVVTTTINVTKNNTLSAGSALDALQSVPSVTVDIDGNICYRGSDKVLVLVDGAESGLREALDQLPAEAVEKIVVISNPSAAFDAEGMSGIINIELKKGAGSMSNSSIVINGGYHDLAGANIAYSPVFEKLKLALNASINHKGLSQEKEHFRSNFEAPDKYDYHQYDYMEQKKNNYMLRTSISYPINNNNTISAAVSATSSNSDADRNIEYYTSLNDEQLETDYNKSAKIDYINNYLDASIEFKTTFADDSRQQLNTGLFFSASSQEQEMNNVLTWQLTNSLPEMQNTIDRNNIMETGLSVDYSSPLTEKMTLETGLGSSFRKTSTSFSSESYIYDYLRWDTDNELLDDFTYFENINSIYILLSAEVNKTNIEAGIRTEHTLSKIKDSGYNSYIDFFPTLRINTRINNHHTPYAVISRRINRPSFDMIIPFREEYADDLNTHIGNPLLDPEYITSIELGDHISYKKVKGKASVYYRHINDAVSRIKSAANDSAMVVTYINLDRALLAGTDFSINYSPFTWLNIITNANLFYTWMDMEAMENCIDQDMFAWDGSIMLRAKAGKKYSLQLASYYRSELPLSLGIIKERYHSDVAISKSILKGKGSLVFRVSDIFNSYSFGYNLEGTDRDNYRYKQVNTRKLESRFFILSFRYNLDPDHNKDKRKRELFYLDSFER